MEEKNNVVYCHLNKINGKRYIGISKCVERRWEHKGYNYKDANIFSNAIKKYGWDNFEHIILEENLTREEANEREKYYIQLYKTTDDNFGYNISSGGDNNFIRKPLTDEQKQKVSEATKKAMNEPERRKHMLNVYASKDWLKKNSEATKLQWQNSDLRKKVVEANGKKVQCIETGIIYESCTAAGLAIGVNRNCISNCCRGTQKTAKNLHWRYI